MVVFDPCIHFRASVQYTGIGGFPCTVKDAIVYVAPFCGFTRFAGIPCAHISGGADRLILIKYNLQFSGIFAANCIQNMLNDFRHVKQDDESARNITWGAQCLRGDANPIWMRNKFFD